MKNHLKEILLALADANIFFVIAGGVAAVLHGVERVTLDINIALDWHEANVKRFIEVMNLLGLSPRAPIPASSLLDAEQREWMVKEKNALVFTFTDVRRPLRQVDVFLADTCQYSDVAPRSQIVDINGRQLKIVSRETLIGMKRRVMPPRPKDLMDIAELERLDASSS